MKELIRLVKAAAVLHNVLVGQHELLKSWFSKDGIVECLRFSIMYVARKKFLVSRRPVSPVFLTEIW